MAEDTVGLEVELAASWRPLYRETKLMGDPQGTLWWLRMSGSEALITRSSNGTVQERQILSVRNAIVWLRCILALVFSVAAFSEANAFSVDGFYSGMRRQEAEAVVRILNLVLDRKIGEGRTVYSQYTLTFCGPKWDRLNGVSKQLDEKEFEALFLDYASNFGNPLVDVPVGHETFNSLHLWLRWLDLPNGDTVQMNVSNYHGPMELSVSVFNNSPCKQG